MENNNFFQGKIFFSICLFILISFSGCDTGFQTMGSSEHGVVFSEIPTFLGGGVKKKPVGPSEKVFIMPWEKLYRIDTGIQSVSWGSKGHGDNTGIDDYVQTRAIDGNEVKLSMTVRYRVLPERVWYVIQKVGSDNESIMKLVSVISRADIRTHMNTLRTEDFFNRPTLQAAKDRVKASINARLLNEGIKIEDVIYDDHMFARERADGTLDTSYEDQINETQRTKQNIDKERNRIKTAEEEMKQKYVAAEGKYKQIVERANGELLQATARGDAKYNALVKDAQRVAQVGQSEVDSMKSEIEALTGPGGKALLRKEIVKALMEKDPKFILLNSGQGSSGNLDLSKTDTNELIRQIGILGLSGQAVLPLDPQESKEVNPTQTTVIPQFKQ